MIDKYCVYIYSLHYVQREYIYHTTNSSRGWNRTTINPHVRCHKPVVTGRRNGRWVDTSLPHPHAGYVTAQCRTLRVYTSRFRTKVLQVAMLPVCWKGGWDSNTTAICQYSDVPTDWAPLKKVGVGVTFHISPPMVKLQSTNSSSRRPSSMMPSIMWSMMRSMMPAWSLQFP